MTTKVKAILLSIVGVLLIGGGVFIGYLIWHKTPGEFTSNPKPQPPPVVNPHAPDPFACGKNIFLSGNFVPLGSNNFHVEGKNNCMTATRDFTIGFTPKIHHWVPQLSYGYLFNLEKKEFHHSIDGIVFYSFGRVALGIGGSSIFGANKLYDIGPKISIQASF
jgi:hypothetical protein